MIRIRIGKHIEATVNEQKWSCENKVFERVLNSLSNPRGVSTAVPDKDRYLADNALRVLGGTILYADPPPYRVPGRIY